jgi:hypothetical protein
MELNHIEAVKNFKDALDAMVQSREIRVDYANQLVRLMRVYLPQYAKPCGYAGAFDFVPPKTVQVARVAPIAQMAEAEPVKKNDAGAIRPPPHDGPRVGRYRRPEQQTRYNHRQNCRGLCE